MKKIILCLILVVSTCFVSAQDISAADSAILNRIYAKNKHYHSMQAPFKHDYIKKGKTNHRHGTFYCERVIPSQKGDVEAKIAMLYSYPKDDYYVITTTHLYNGLNGRHLHFNYKYIQLMKLLGNAMAWAVNGDVYSLYNNFTVNYKMTTDQHNYIITLSSDDSFNKGISRLVLKYDKTTCLISYLEIEEKLGIIHKYSMGVDAQGKYHQPTLNKPIPQKVYLVP